MNETVRELLAESVSNPSLLLQALQEQLPQFGPEYLMNALIGALEDKSGVTRRKEVEGLLRQVDTEIEIYLHGGDVEKQVSLQIIGRLLQRIDSAHTTLQYAQSTQNELQLGEDDPLVQLFRQFYNDLMNNLMNES